MVVIARVGKGVTIGVTVVGDGEARGTDMRGTGELGSGIASGLARAR